MKKCYLYAGMLAAGMLAFSACSNDDDPIPAGGQENAEVATGKQVIVLDMQDTDVLATKSRPLYSTTNQGAELVTDVKLLVFEHATDAGEAMSLVNVLHISQWDLNSTDYNYGRKYSYELKDDEKLDNNKTYTILAVGQDESNTSATSFAPYKILTGENFDGQEYISALAEASWGTSATWNAASGAGEGFLKTVARTDMNEAEIFSGISKPVSLKMDGGFTAEVLLKRQVAGVLGYFTKIPAFVLNENATNNGEQASDYTAVKKIRLVAAQKNTQLDLTYDLGKQKDDATEVGDEFAVNGFNAAATKDAAFENGTDNAYKVYEIDLTNWFKAADNSATDASFWYGENGTYTSGMEIPSLGDELAGAANTPSWVNAFDQANDNPRVATNSVLAGEFVIPFNNVDENEGSYTFELQLLGGVDDQILNTWNVRLDESELCEQDYDKYIYNIYRNHLYQIGQRGGGDSPDDPGKDPDDPQPLDKDQELLLRINDNWEFIHNMELD